MDNNKNFGNFINSKFKKNKDNEIAKDLENNDSNQNFQTVTEERQNQNIEQPQQANQNINQDYNPNYNQNYSQNNSLNNNVNQNCNPNIDQKKVKLDKSDAIRYPLSKMENGNFYWYYNMNLAKNLTVLFTVWKVLLVVSVILTILLQVGFFFADGRFDLGFLKFSLLYFTPGLLILVTIAYVVYAIIMKSSYIVVFEMNEHGISHTQLASQSKKAQVIGALATLAGAQAGSASLMSTGILAGSRNSIYTTFNKVNSVTVKRNRNVIHLKERPFYNQIYVDKEHYDLILEYILERVPAKAKYNKALYTNIKK